MTLGAPTFEQVLDARERLSGIACRTPLLALPDAGPTRVLAKLENLQSIGSFKLRGAANAMALADPALLARGVYTASAGNMAQGVAWCARARGIACQVIVPDSAPANKVAAIVQLGAEVMSVPFDQWWQVLVDHGALGFDGLFVHPFADTAVMAGNGTIALELFDDEPAIDTVLVPWGGGGLACGIASAVRHLNSRVRVVAVEVNTAAPLTASLAQDTAVTIVPVLSFVDGIGGRGVSREIWPLAQELIAGVVTVSLDEVSAAIKLLATQLHVIAEGAGAASVAAAMRGVPHGSCVACIVSGGNINTETLAVILGGETP